MNKYDKINNEINEEWSQYYLNFICKYSDKICWNFITQNPNITPKIKLIKKKLINKYK